MRLSILWHSQLVFAYVHMGQCTEYNRHTHNAGLQDYPPLGLPCLFDLAEAALLAMPAATLLAEAAKLLLAALCGLLPTEPGADTFDCAPGLPVGITFPADAALAAVLRPAAAVGCAAAWSWLLAAEPFCGPGCFAPDLVAPLLLLALCAGALL